MNPVAKAGKRRATIRLGHTQGAADFMSQLNLVTVLPYAHREDIIFPPPSKNLSISDVAAVQVPMCYILFEFSPQLRRERSRPILSVCDKFHYIKKSN